MDGDVTFELPQGTVRVEREGQWIEAMYVRESDPAWRYHDAAGHEHYYQEIEGELKYPTLEYVPVVGHCADCGEDVDDGFYRCAKCKEPITPGTRTPAPRYIITSERYTLNGEPSTKAEVDKIVYEFMKDKEAKDG